MNLIDFIHCLEIEIRIDFGQKGMLYIISKDTVVFIIDLYNEEIFIPQNFILDKYPMRDISGYINILTGKKINIYAYDDEMSASDINGIKGIDAEDEELVKLYSLLDIIKRVTIINHHIQFRDEYHNKVINFSINKDNANSKLSISTTHANYVDESLVLTSLKEYLGIELVMVNYH